MVQIIEQTDEEKLAMYMRLPKKKLAEMLIECNKIISRINPIVTYTPVSVCRHCCGEGWIYAKNGNVRKCKHC